MSDLLFLDSFDHYSTAQRQRKWTSAPAASIVAGRNGNGGKTGPISIQWRKTLAATYTTLTAGMAIKFDAQSLLNGVVFQFLNLFDGCEVSLLGVGDGRFRLQFDINDGTKVKSDPCDFSVHLDQWYYIEMQAAVTGGASSVSFVVTVRVNESQVLAYSDSITVTQDHTDAGLNRLVVITQGATVDDLYVTDNEFLGDNEIVALFPNGAGDLTDWTPSAGANYAAVDDNPADDDTTYVETANAADVDLYGMENIGGSYSGAIKGAQLLALQRKDDEGSATTRLKWKSGVTTIDGPSFSPSASSYLYDIQAERKSLFTAADWTATEIDAMQNGIERLT